MKKSTVERDPEIGVPVGTSDKHQQWLDEEVEIEFYNLEDPGVAIKFSYGTTKNPKRYTLFHGGKYRLPRKLIQHVETRQTPLKEWRPDGDGRLVKKTIGYKPRFQCRQTFAM